jgi:hypothetical protein
MEPLLEKDMPSPQRLPDSFFQQDSGKGATHSEPQLVVAVSKESMCLFEVVNNAFNV